MIRKLFASVLLLAAATLSAQTVVQTCTNGAYATSATCTFGSNVTTGHVLAAWGGISGAYTLATPTNSGTATTSAWTLAGTQANGQGIWVASVTATGTLTITSSYTGSSSTFAVAAYELTGATTTVDQVSYSTFAYCSTCGGPSITTTVGGDMVLNFAAAFANSTFTATGVFGLNFSTYSAAAAWTTSGMYYAQAAAGAVSASWTLSAGTSGIASIIAIKGPAVPTVQSINGATISYGQGNVNTLNGKFINPYSGYLKSWNTLAFPLTALPITVFTDFHGGTNAAVPNTTSLGNSTYGGAPTFNVTGMGPNMVYSNGLAIGALYKPVNVTGTVYNATGTLTLGCTTTSTTNAATECGVISEYFSGGSVSSLGFWVQTNCNANLSIDCGALGGLVSSVGSDYVLPHFNPAPGGTNPCNYNGIEFETTAGTSTTCLPYTNGATYRINVQENKGGAPFTVTFSNGSAVITGTQTLGANQSVELSTTGALPTNFATGTIYYVSATGLSGTTFELSAKQGGTPIVAGSAGSGTQTTTIYNQLSICLQNGTFVGNLVLPANSTAYTTGGVWMGVSGEGATASGYTYYFGGYALDATGKFSSTECLL
jgi:hypothetical protein